jgi:hypothetical protein
MTENQRPLSLWLRLLAAFIAWGAFRAIFFTVLGQSDPEFQLAVERGVGPAVVLGQLIYGVIGIAAAVAIWQRMPFALWLALAALALDTSLTVFGVQQFTADPTAVREAYAASRAARGLPIPAERLDIMFSPEAMTVMWVVAGLMSLVPLAILLWRKWELSPDQPAMQNRSA